jgi:aspartyl aminopeptidase
MLDSHSLGELDSCQLGGIDPNFVQHSMHSIREIGGSHDARGG